MDRIRIATNEREGSAVEIHPAALMAGDRTKYGAVSKVQSVQGRNNIVRVWFDTGSFRDFTRFERVTVLS